MSKKKEAYRLSRNLIEILRRGEVWLEDGTSSSDDQYSIVCSDDLGRAMEIVTKLEELFESKG